MSWTLLIALLLGLIIGLATVYFVRLRPAAIAKDFASQLYHETEAQRKAHIEAILAEMKTSFGSLSVEAVTRSTREFVTYAQAMMETDRQVRAKLKETSKEEVGQQLQHIGAQIEKVTQFIKDVEKDRSERLKELSSQLKTMREHGPASGSGAGDRKRGDVAAVEERFEALAQAAPMALVLSRGTDGLILFANRQFGFMFGLPSKSLLGHPLPDFYVNFTDRDMVFRELKRIGAVRNYELKCKKSDGASFTAVMSVSALTLDGEPVHLHGFTDVTEWRQASEAVKSTQSILSAILECTADGILAVDRNGKIVSYNQKFLHMWRIPESVIETRSENQMLMFVLDQLQDYEEFLKRVRKLNAEPEAESYDVLEFKDGRLFERYSLPQRLDNEIFGRVWSYRDVTERKWADEALEESEEQLRQSQKMEAVGRLAGGIAHDLNNLLTIITGYSHFLLTSLDPRGAAYQDVEEIQQATRRAEALIQQLLAFSRKQPRQPRTLDLNEVITGMIQMLQRLLGEEIRLVTSLSEVPCPVLVDPNQIGQVLMNLLVNARDAMPEGGTVKLETGRMDLDQAHARTHAGARPGPYAVLTVTDMGIGMDAHTLAHCLEPFFTTKPTGQGTGLGLATVYGIVKQSDGAIDVQSQPGQGTTVKIYLPRLDHVDDPESAEPAVEALPRGSETILLVEDDAKVRRLVRQTIERQGYSVLEASSGAAALAVAEQSDSIHLLLTDIVMPEMSGAELATQLATARPGLKVLYMSGYTEHATTLRHHLISGTTLLLKPFTPEELARRVRDALDTPLPV